MAATIVTGSLREAMAAAMEACCCGSGSGGGGGILNCGGCPTENFMAGTGTTIYATIDIDCLGISGLVVPMPAAGGGWLGTYSSGDFDFAGSDRCDGGAAVLSLEQEITLTIAVSCCGIDEVNPVCDPCRWTFAFEFSGRTGATLYSAEYLSHNINQESAGCSPLIFEEKIITVVCQDDYLANLTNRHCNGYEDTEPQVLPEDTCCGFGGNDALTILSTTVGCIITINISG